MRLRWLPLLVCTVFICACKEKDSKPKETTVVEQCKHLARVAKQDGGETWERFDFPTCIEEQKVMIRAFGANFEKYQECIGDLKTWKDKLHCDSMSAQSLERE